MEEEFEEFMRSQLRTLKAQMDVIKDYLRKYEEGSIRLKKTITTELIDALIKRFEKNEKMIEGLEEKLASTHFTLQEQLTRSVKDLREELSEAELSRAISRIFEEGKIKISSKPLEELKNT